MGTSIKLFGQIDQVISAVVTIDADTSTSIQSPMHLANTVHAFYQSPNLSDARHNLTLTSSWDALRTTFIIDYATITFGEYTSVGAGDVLGEDTFIKNQLIVDESDFSVIFAGNWTRNTGILMDNSVHYMPTFGKDVTPYRRYPYGGTASQSSSMGASVTFRFNGTSVSVFGVNLFSSSQSINMTYTLDGKLASTHNYTARNSTNYQWWRSADGLSPTIHTLEIEVGPSQDNAAFNLDYITYTPSFPSLAEEQGLGALAQPLPLQLPQYQPLPFKETTLPLISTTPPLDRSGNGTGLETIIGPVVVGVVVSILLFMRRMKLSSWFSTDRNGATGTVNETVRANPRLQLEELYFSLQRVIEEIRQDETARSSENL
ncbi:hypothetical protein C0993_008202 [Termitomyces sp. T159_Od127]|nr:hypothetical protein C0993_008202 [Termitomyces sp. T159_Od127]